MLRRHKARSAIISHLTCSNYSGFIIWKKIPKSARTPPETVTYRKMRARRSMAAMTRSAAALRWHCLHTLQRPECLPRVSCCFGKNLGRVTASESRPARNGPTDDEVATSRAQRPTNPPLPFPSKSALRPRLGVEFCPPFRSVRMFFYLAFMASGALGGLIATTRLIAALSNPAKAGDVPEISKGLIIDIGGVSVFAFLFSRENAAKNAQLARLSREESLSKLKLRIDGNRIILVSSLRGAARLVMCAGRASFITEAFKLSEPYTNDLLQRGVLIMPFPTDGNTASFKFDETEEMKDLSS